MCCLFLLLSFPPPPPLPPPPAVVVIDGLGGREVGRGAMVLLLQTVTVNGRW